METQIPYFGTVEAAARFWIFIFGMWAVCAVVNVAIADIKERSYFIWGIIGLVFGPLGVIALLFRASKKKEEARRARKAQKAGNTPARPPV